MPNTVSTSGTRVRCAWEVTAGLIPEKPIPEYSRSWIVTSEVYYSPDGPKFCEDFQKQALDYVKSLQDPRSLNWVKLDWIYL